MPRTDLALRLLHALADTGGAPVAQPTSFMRRLVWALAARPYPSSPPSAGDGDEDPSVQEHEPTVPGRPRRAGRAVRPDTDWAERLSPDHVALLERLADGQTIAAAAAAEWMSLRTANRRVAELRALLGVSSNRELVAAYLRARTPKQ